MTVRYVAVADAASIAGTAVVVDVLRAFTTAAWAMYGGADHVVLAADAEQALRIKAAIPHSLGCADGAPRPGFELVNSPVKVRDHNLAGRVLVHCTTNGTAAAVAARAASRLYCAAFVNARATARALRGASRASITVVITGGGGAADEDVACADYIVALLDDPTVRPDRYCIRANESASASDLRRGAELGYEGIHSDDIAACLEADRFEFAMVATPAHGSIRLDPEP